MSGGAVRTLFLFLSLLLPLGTVLYADGTQIDSKSGIILFVTSSPFLFSVSPGRRSKNEDRSNFK